MAHAAIAAPALRHQLARTGRATLYVRGNSMKPLLRDGSMVELRPRRQAESLAGRIVAVDAGPIVIVHRVTLEAGNWIETRGIACGKLDPRWQETAIIGVVSAIPELGGLGRWPRPLASCAAAAAQTRRFVARRLR